MVPVELRSENSEAYGHAAHTTEKSSEPDIPQRALGLDISYAAFVPALGTKETVYECDTELNARRRIDTSTLPALVYGKVQPRMSSDSPSTAERVQRYRSLGPSPESPRQRGWSEIPEFIARGESAPVVTDAYSPSQLSFFSHTPNETFDNMSYKHRRYTLVPNPTIEITPPILDIPRKKSPPPILEPTHLQSPVERHFTSERIADSRASYDELMAVETSTTSNAMSVSAGVQTLSSSPVEIPADGAFSEEDVATVGSFVFKEELNKVVGSGEELVISQPAPFRPRGLTRELRASNELSEGFDGPYWRSRSVRKRKRAVSEMGFTSVN
jgi:hypothetical protein